MTLSVSEIVKSVLARLLFTGHSLLAIWWVVQTTSNPRLWLLSCILIALAVEFVVTLIHRKGKEYKWFTPSIFCHLMATIPCAWILELHLHDRRVLQNSVLASGNNSTFTGAKNLVDVARWTDLVEQTMMLLLIVGRWLLPKAGSMTRDSLSQLLLINVAMCADIIEFFDIINLDEAKRSKKLTIAIMVLWTWSLMQFPFNATAKLETELDIDYLQRNKVSPEMNGNLNGRNITDKIFLDTGQIKGHTPSSRRQSRDVRRLAGHVLMEEETIDIIPLSRPAHARRKSFVPTEHVVSRSARSSRDYTKGGLSLNNEMKGPQMKDNLTPKATTEEQSQQERYNSMIHRPSLDGRSLKDRPLIQYRTEIDNDDGLENGKPSRIRSDLFSILLSLFMQDGPFLTFRLFIIAQYKTIEYMMLFLTVKNALVLILQVYRLCILYCPCHDHHDNDFSPENEIDASARLKNVQVAISHEEMTENNTFVHSDRLKIQWKRTTLNKVGNPLIRTLRFQ